MSSTFYSTSAFILNTDISSSTDECTHCAGSVKSVSALRSLFLKRRGRHSVFLSGPVQVVDPAGISSLLAQLTYT